MNKATEITTSGIAELFGVHKNTFSGCVDYIFGFPKPIRTETNRKIRLYKLMDVKNWAEEKDVVAIIRHASAKRQREIYKDRKENTESAKKSVNSLRRMFFTSQFRKT